MPLINSFMLYLFHRKIFLEKLIFLKLFFGVWLVPKNYQRQKNGQQRNFGDGGWNSSLTSKISTNFVGI
jgi:hypothetical protein